LGDNAGRGARAEEDEAMDQDAKKTALLMIPYGLQVIGARAGAASTLGTVNWTTQASFKPPLVVVGVKAGSGMHALIEQSGAFSLSFLGTGQKDVAFAFFRHVEPEGDRIGGYEVTAGPATGCPVLDVAPAWIECTVAGFYELGDHTTVVGEVVEAGVAAESEPLTLAEVGVKYGG
jgi:flavin reductase (DIM6/NTAB) family NADH-FMN oxidoreductase RutF